VKQTYLSSSISKFRSDIILGIPSASVVSFPLPNPKASSIFFSIFRQNIVANIFVACAMKLIVRWSLLFVAFGREFFIEILASCVRQSS
jgi:hypothetical protein